MGLVGSVIAAALISLLEYLKVFEFLNQSVPFWLLLIVIIACIPAITTLASIFRNKLTSNRRVFVISSAFASAPFFTELIKEIIHSIESRGYDPILKLPLEDFSNVDMNKHVDKLLNDLDGYAAGIFIHAEPDKNYEHFQSFSNKFHKPKLFLDCHKNDLYRSFDENSAFVGYDNSITGKIAGDTAAMLFKEKGISSPKILVIASKLQSERQDNFASHIRSELPNCELTIDDNGEFSRKVAHRIVLENLRNKIKNHERVWDLIFCTNDEMALGALSAIHELNNKTLSNMLILGCDGIEEAKIVIDRKDRHFVNTVDQNPKLLSHTGVETLFGLINGHEVAKETYLTPKMYVPIY